NMLKKSPGASRRKAKEKGIFRKAGEMIGSIGFHLMDGKDKVVGAVSDEFDIVKKTIKKKLAKKKIPLSSRSKKPSKKAAPKKRIKKTARKVKKVAKKY